MENEQQENAGDFDESSEAIPPSPTTSSQGKKVTKQIKKSSTDSYLKKLSKQYPKPWKDICLLREMIKAKQVERNYYQHILDKKLNKFRALKRPGSAILSPADSDSSSDSSSE